MKQLSPDEELLMLLAPVSIGPDMCLLKDIIGIMLHSGNTWADDP
jgi:hypothetical protein